MQLLQLGRASASNVGFSQVSSLTLCVTHACNLTCSHCSVEAVDARGGQLMHHDVVRAVARELLAKHGAAACHVVFFGGEPLLAPAAWYADTIRILRESGAQLTFGIQTNGTILSAELIALLREHRFQISVSLDGPPELNDRVRERGARVVECLTRLIGAGLEPKVVGLIAPHTWDRTRELLDYYAALGLRDVRLNTCFAIGRNQSGPELSQAQLAAAWRAAVDWMEESASLPLIERNTAEKVHLFARAQRRESVARSGCASFYCHAGRSYLSIAPDGGIYPCSDVSFTRPEFRLGSVFSLDSGRDLRALKAFHRKGDWWEQCSGCAASAMCELGCPAFTPPGTENVHLECAATKLLHASFVERAERIVALSDRLMERGAKA